MWNQGQETRAESRPIGMDDIAYGRRGGVAMEEGDLHHHSLEPPLHNYCYA